MARRERERFTERARPHRKEPSQSTSQPVDDGGWRNPVVLVAVGGLVLAVMLAVGFLIGRGGTETAATEGTATAVASLAGTAMAPTAAADITPTMAVAPPTGIPGKTFSEPGDEKLDPAGKAYFATIETPHGPIVMELWPELAPQTVNSFVFLTRQGFYDGLTFHRVVPDFVAQGGDPAGNGTGGPGYSVEAEFNAANPVPHRVGTLAMARSGDPNSAGSQFYIVSADGASASSLDGQYTVFGHVIKGMKAVQALTPRDPMTATTPGDPMTKVTIDEKPKSESVVSPDDIRQGKLPANE